MHVKLHMNPGSWEVSNTGGTDTIYKLNGYSWSLNMFHGYEEYTAMWDRYRLNKIVVKFWWGCDSHPRMPQTDPTPTHDADNNRPYVFTCKDYDTIGSPPSVNNIWENSTCVRHLAKVFSVKLTPSIILESATLRLPKWKQWIDCVKPDLLMGSIQSAIAQPPHMGRNTLFFQSTGYFSFASRI